MKEINRYKDKSDPSSRYVNLDRIKRSDGSEIIETPDIIEIPRSTSDKFYTVESGYENRLDLVAYKFYGNSLLWWLIAKASNIIDPMSVPVGTKLRIPPKEVYFK